MQKFSLDGAFTTGKNETVEVFLQIISFSEFEGICTELLEHMLMFYECPLQGKNCNRHSLIYPFQP